MDIEAELSDGVARTKPWVERLARMGYAVKGVVYFLIGLLAMQAAFGWGGETTGAEGALKALERQPFGQIVLSLTAIGLFGYALWRLIQAWVDPDHRDSNSLKRIVQRAGYVISALTYGLLGWQAAQMVMGIVMQSSGENSAREWTAWLMSQPFGPWLVALVGLIVCGVGLFQIYYGMAAKFRKELKLHQMSRGETAWAMRSGRIGYSARGLIYLIIGNFLVWAAIQFNPNAAVDTEGALDKVAQQPFGAWLLALVALGLMAYAAFAFVQARYRTIDVDGDGQ